MGAPAALGGGAPVRSSTCGLTVFRRLARGARRRVDLTRTATTPRAVVVSLDPAVVAPLAWRRARPVASSAAVYSSRMLQLALVRPARSSPPTSPCWCRCTASPCTAPGGRTAMAIVRPLVGSVAARPLRLVRRRRTPRSRDRHRRRRPSRPSWAFGLVRRSRRETIEALRDRAERLEVERDQQAQIATAAERARIAREMHDIVAHSLSVVIAQADGGRYAADADPAAAERALGTIAETGRAALADMRRLLGVLREGPAAARRRWAWSRRTAPRPLPRRRRCGAGARPGAGGRASRRCAGHRRAGRHPPGRGTVVGQRGSLRPQPDAADISELVEQARDERPAGLLGQGGRRAAPAARRRAHASTGSARRPLTNVLKHAGPRPRRHRPACSGARTPWCSR